ncbi:H17B6-like protein [Mya arenaria]|uniref:H17B6-like protein n=1 Tax=Mya arenaria TaxID=6604 RepID=A0ABY7EMR8_MYAAR|nr:H17B6-like protein [Mya arenaria]
MFSFLIDCFEYILLILYFDFTKGLICEDRTLITTCVITFLSLIFLYVTYRCFEWIIRRGNVGNIAKKSVFITGCDTGFGNLLAKALDQKGVLVYASCFTGDGAEQLHRDTSRRLKTLIVDVLDKESITDAFRTIEQEVKDEVCIYRVKLTCFICLILNYAGLD